MTALALLTVLGAPPAVELCNQVWPPKGMVLIDGPANLRNKPNGKFVVELNANTEATVDQADGSWVRIHGAHADEPFAGWTHETNINLIRLCGIATAPGLLEVSETEGTRVVAFGHRSEPQESGGVIHVFATGDKRRPMGLFMDATDMTAGTYLLLGPDGIEPIPSLSRGRRSLKMVKRDGTIGLMEDFHCLGLRYEGRVKGGRWSWRNARFDPWHEKQTIQEAREGCFAWSKPGDGRRVPLAPGTGVRLLGITSDARRIELELADGIKLYMDAGQVSWRCLSNLSCAG